MSQNDFNIANQGFPSFRSDLNSALQALASCSSGSAAPTTTYANMLWMDTANNKLKVRNEDNDAWIDLFDLNQTADTAMLAGVTATVAELNVLDGITSSTAELNILDGVTLTAAQLNATGQLAGRNRIINGQGRINQRGYTSGTATSGANEYTLDRWRVVTSGQSLTFTGNDAARTMTAPAGGVEQVIEGANIEGGTYVLNWTGTATATVGGVARTKGETFTLSANTNVTVRFTSGTFTDAQLELGSTPTVYERLSFGQELANCQRYYEKSYEIGTAPGAITTVGLLQMWNSSGSANTAALQVIFKVQKRTAPTVTSYSPATGASGQVRDGSGSDRTATVQYVSTGGAHITNSAIGNSANYSAHWVADAEP